MQPIDTNIPSQIAQHSLTTAQNQLATAIQQLSTGLRINSAADDAAGYAIVQRMSSQINGLSQAGENVNDGVSLLQVAAGGVSQIIDNFQKIRVLAIEAANPTYTTSDRQNMQDEVDQLIASNNQIVQQTNFNGTTLLDGTFINQQLQIGANPTQTLMLTIPPALSQASTGVTVQAPLQQATVSANVVAAIGASNLKIDGVAIGASAAGPQGQSSDSAWAIANAITNANIPNLSVSASSSLNATVESSGNVSINGIALGNIAGANANAVAANAASAINSVTASTGVSASAYGSALSLATTDGTDISISGTALQQSASTNGTVTLATTASPYASSIVISGSNPGNAGLTAGTFHSVDSGGTAPIVVPAAQSVADVSTVDNAQQAITYVDEQIANCNSISAYLGANQNALTSIHSSLSNSFTNLSAAQARIQDTDYASATATLVQGQILRKVSMAMLAQANADPASVIKLLAE